MDGSDYWTLTGDDGGLHRCRLLNCFQFGSKEYALLLRDRDVAPLPGQDGSGDEVGPTTVIMELIQNAAGEAIFRTIADDEEFQKVVAYLRELTSPECSGELDDA